MGEVGIPPWRLVQQSRFYEDFKIPRNPGGTEHRQTVCTRPFFSSHTRQPGNKAIQLVGTTAETPPTHDSLGTRLYS